MMRPKPKIAVLENTLSDAGSQNDSSTPIMATSHLGAGRTRAPSGLTSGSRAFDELIDQLQVAFCHATHAASGDPAMAAEAANELAIGYQALTGRCSPDADDGAGALARVLLLNLPLLPTSLTDAPGQSMLRSL